MPTAMAYDSQRHRMVQDQIRRRGIDDPRILEAFMMVPRHEFVPEGSEQFAYEDRPLPIGHGQTISQPYIVALTTSLADPQPDSRVLDVGTGCGYQAAILACLCAHVYTIEVVEPLATEAQQRLRKLQLDNVTTRQGDGYEGWPEAAPFDAIIAAAAAPEIPPALIDQLRPGGRLVIPVGRDRQQLLSIEKLADGTTRTLSATPVSFVPMVPADS